MSKCEHALVHQAASPSGGAVPVLPTLLCRVDASRPAALTTAVVAVSCMAPRPSPARWLAAGLLPVPVLVSPARGVSPRRGGLSAGLGPRSTLGRQWPPL